jgi:uncharacterized protein YlaI
MTEHIKELDLLIEVKRWIDEFLNGQGYCIICGHEDSMDLEYHHVGGKANSPVVVSLCRNCHGKISKIQRRTWPKGWSDKNNTTRTIDAIAIRGLSDLLRLKSDHMLSGKND